MCAQFITKSKFNLQIYIIKFSASGRIIINAIPKIEELYGITFDIKGATQLIQTTSECECDHIWNRKNINNIWNGRDTQNRNHQQNNTLGKNQTSDNNKHNEQQPKNQLFSDDTYNLNNGNKTRTENTDNRLYQIPTNIKDVSPKHESCKREVVTQQSKSLKDFNNKTEKEQIRITEEINELKERFAREIKLTWSELKFYYGSKEESLK